MFTRLVVGIDGFEGGEDALVLARMIARTRGGGELILVHACACSCRQQCRLKASAGLRAAG